MGEAKTAADEDRSSAQAMAIYQEWLDSAGALVLAGNCAQLIDRHVSLPYLHRALDSEMVVETEAEMTTGWGGFADFLKSNGVTHYIRVCSAAEFLSDDYIEGFHTAHLMRDAHPVVPPYLNRMVLHRRDGIWRMCETASAVWHSRWPIRTLRAPATPVATFSGNSHDFRRKGTDPTALFQSFLDTLSEAFVTGDRTLLFDKLDLPLSLYTATDSLEIGSHAIAEALLSGAITQYGIDFLQGFSFAADHAEFIGPHTLFGYHSAHVPAGSATSTRLKGSMMLMERDESWYLKSASLTIAEGDTDHAAALTRYEIERRHRRTGVEEVPR